MTTALLGPLIPKLFATIGVTDVGNAGVFELDGNIVKDSSGTFPTDWGALFNSTGNRQALPPGGIASAWVNDGPDNVTDFSTFTTGSKDTLDISNGGWKCTSSSTLTPKDKILHDYSFAIKPTSGQRAGDLLIYGGFERFANNGAGDLGYWILQDQSVGCNITTKGATNFNGTHTVGDILIVGEFSTGGSVTTLNEFEWVGGTNPLANLTATGGADCREAPDTANICGRSNIVSITTPWATQDKSPSPNQLATAEFFEVGVDITRLLPSSTGCFNTFLFDTRTSPSVTATLKDYAEGTLNTCGSLSGIKFEDVNATGQQFHDGEPRLSGWTINLYNSANALIQTAVTDATGNYTFPNISAGTYTVCEVNLNPSLWTQSFPSTAHNPPCSSNAQFGYSVTVGAGQTTTNLNFGNFRRGSISGFKFIDLNGNGKLDPGEGCPTTPPENAGCAGITVNLSGTTGMRSSVSQTTTTDSTGAYSFTNLIPGTYTVTVSEPTGFQCSFPTPCIYTITIQSAQASSGHGFGDFSNGTISGFKFIDTDNNGILDNGEGCPAAPNPNHSGCAGITVNLTGTTGMSLAVNRTTATANDGSYSFTNLPPGTYTITIVEPAGFQCSTNPCSHAVTLTSDQVVTFQNFGDVRPIVKITGFGYTNTPTGTFSSGIVSGETVYTFQLKNFGNATAVVTGTLVVTLTGAGGSFTCSGTGVTKVANTCTQSFTVTLTPGSSASMSLTLDYNSLDSGSTVTAVLNASYTTTNTDGSRIVSGSPATIQFTIQGN